MKYKWIFMICAVALFSAHQTHRTGAETPDYARGPAMVRSPLIKSKARIKNRAGHKTKAQNPAQAGS